MISGQELRDLYDAVIKNSGHPDPIGYLSRAIALSGGDIYYHDDDGYIGFYPVKPSVAHTIIGSNDVSSLEGNIVTTLGMEIKLLSENDYDTVIKIMLDGRKAEGIDEISKEVIKLLNPRKAKVSDIISLLDDEVSRKSKKLSKREKKFFEALLSYGGTTTK